MSSKLKILWPHDKLTVEEALGYSRNYHRAEGLDEVVIVGWCKNGAMHVVSSIMTTERAYFLLTLAADKCLSDAFPGDNDGLDYVPLRPDEGA